MRILLILALVGSVVYESHQLAGQTADTPAQVADETLAQQTTADQTNLAPSQSTTETSVADQAKPNLRFNLPIKTAGGTQVWTDQAYRSGYRIQQHSLTGHFRLLDTNDVRQAWGTRQQCQAALDQLVPLTQTSAQSSTDPPRVAVLLHGLMRTSHSMKSLETSLRENGFDDVIRFQYASTRRSIDDHADALQSVLESQSDETQFHFVGHSMGNIVVRRMVGELQSTGDEKNILPRCRSMVMLGPPNQGASIARRLAPTGLYGLVTGKGGLELGPKWDEFEKKLATPPFPFVIVAGDLSSNPIQNPLVDGSGDLVVSLDEAKLDGCEEFHTIDALHSFLMNDQRAIKIAVDFLSNH